MASDFNEDEFISGLGNYIPTPAPAAIPAPEKSGFLRRAVGDTLVSGLQSAIAAPEALVGLADIPTGGAVGKGLEYAGYRPKEARAAVEEWYSPEAKAAAARVEAAKGFVPTAAAMIQDPSTIYHGIVKSAAPMLMGGVAARGVKALTGASPYIAGAAGEGIVGAGSAAEQIRQQTESGFLTPGQSLSAVGTGLGQMAVGAVGGRAAQKFGLEDVETMIARGGRREAIEKAPGALKRIGGGTALEAGEETLQSAHETVMQNLALGRPTFEGVSEAAAQGMMTGGVMGGAMNILGARKPKDLLKPEVKEEAPVETPVAPGQQPSAEFTPEEIAAFKAEQAAGQTAMRGKTATAEETARRDEEIRYQMGEQAGTGPEYAGFQEEMFQTPMGPMTRVNAELLADAERIINPGQADMLVQAEQADQRRQAIEAQVAQIEAEGRALAEKGSTRLTDADMSKIGIKTAKQKSELTKLDLRRDDHYNRAVALLQSYAEDAKTPEQFQATQNLYERVTAQKTALDEMMAPKKAALGAKRAALEKRILNRKAMDAQREMSETAQIGEELPPEPVVSRKGKRKVVPVKGVAPAAYVAPEGVPVIAPEREVLTPYEKVARFGKVKAPALETEITEVSPEEVSAAELKQAGEPGFVQETQSALAGRATELGVTEEKTGAGIVKMLKTPPKSGTAKDNLEWKRRVTAELDKIEEMAPAMRSVAEPTQGQTAAELKARLSNAFASPHFMNRTVVIHENDAALPEQFASMRSTDGGKTQGFYDPKTKKVHLIANNIDPGVELSVVLHEIGVHMGMKNLLGEKNYGKLIGQVKTWALSSGSIENTLAERAERRVKVAQTNFGEMSEEVADEELLAYFVEEAVNAGIDPTAISSQPKALQDWFRLLWASIKSAVQKLGINPASLTVFDVINLAYGAAQMELDTEINGPPGEGRAMQSVADVIKGNSQDMSKMLKDQAKFALNAALDKVMFTDDLVKRAVRRGLETAADFGRMMNEKSQTRNKYEQQVAKILSEASELSDRTEAEQFIKDSTLSQKWAYKPKWLSAEDAKVDTAMAKRFSELSPEAQKVVEAIFKFGHDTRVQMQLDVNKAINDEYDRLLELETTPEGKAAVEKQRSDKISAVGKYVSALSGPYAPLKRFGNHVIVAKSKEYIEAEKNNDTKALAKLETDPEHYVVEHEEYRANAEQRKDELAAKFKGGYAETWVKEDSHKHVTELPWAGIEKIKTTIEGMPEDTKNKQQMQSLINNLYLQMLDETSARKSDIRRKRVSGAGDMFRSFASQGRSTAHYLSALQHNADINKSVAAMQKDIKDAKGKDRSDMTAVYNELTARYAQSLEYKDNQAVDAAMKFTSFWLLLTSPAYYIQNALQPFMLTLPVLSGRFGVSQSFNAGVEAYKDVTAYIKNTPVHQLDIEKLKLDPKEKEMLKALQAEGLLDMTITQDLGRFVEGEGALSKGKFGKVMRKIWAGPQHVELLNRIASALAAYRLAGTDSKNFGTELAKTTYAKEIISGTHGNYSSFNAPRFFTSSGAMRLITQFRKYQLIQLTLIAKTWHDSFKNADPEERAVARRAALWMLGQHGLMTGAMGLPIPALIWAVAAAFGSDDDEKKDPEQMLRDMLGNEGMADLVTRGLPAALGLSMSTKVGMGNAFSALPFADMPKDKASYEKMLIASLGATAGVGGTMFDAMAKMSRGDYQKGVETAMPVGLKNAMKGFRIATEGVTSTAGDELLKPEDVSLIDGLAQSIGLPTMKVSERQRKQGVVIETDKFYKARTADLKRDYMTAFKDKDAEDIAEVKENWRKLQAARVANGYSRQPMSVLLRAPMEQKRRERKAAGGIEYGAQNRRFVEGLE